MLPGPDTFPEMVCAIAAVADGQENVTSRLIVKGPVKAQAVVVALAWVTVIVPVLPARKTTGLAKEASEPPMTNVTLFDPEVSPRKSVFVVTPAPVLAPAPVFWLERNEPLSTIVSPV